MSGLRAVHHLGSAILTITLDWIGPDQVMWVRSCISHPIAHSTRSRLHTNLQLLFPVLQINSRDLGADTATRCAHVTLHLLLSCVY